MRLLLMLLAPLRESLVIVRVVGWTQSRQEGWRLHLLKIPHFPFNIQRISNAIAVDGVGSPGCVEELDFRFEEDRSGWESIVRDLEEEVRRLRFKGEEDKGRHEDGSRIDLRGDFFINGV